MSSTFAEALDPLVSDGTITSEQESAVIDALSSAGPGGAQGQGQPSPEATPASGQAPSSGGTPPAGQQGSMPDASQMFGSTLDELVGDGTITASQQSAISEALSSAMQQAGPGQQGSSS
jgi:competence protein ComGC